ncbi:hypothetical protein RclHR1_12990006 [Rhizophagus clarus]|uniref:C2H2-type domain-containing protein n=1 Tax=Rhizophagus clarus TaxID=94130 RepID=A0A2Z6Q8S9_9GLOM|nr:hypothetical protein RclHR1_12990006 [Rhizophagus clarus]
MPRSDKKDTTCVCCGYKFTRPAKLRQHYQSNKNQCNQPPEDNTQRSVSRPLSLTPTPVVHTRGNDRRREKPEPIQTSIPQDKNQENDLKTGPSQSTQANREEQAGPSEVTQGKFIDRHARKPRENMKTWECQRLHHELLQVDDEAFEENIPQEVGPREVEQQDAQEQDAIPKEPTQKDIIFKECPVGRDPERPHRNHSLMSKWVGKIPHPNNNPTYAFIQPIAKPEEYKKLPYMPQLIGLIRPKIKEVLQTELHKKDQIKSAIVALCRYSIAKRKPDDTSEPTEKGSRYILELILKISIETYILCRALGGSYNPTLPKLANKKCTINPDNQGLIDPETNKPSEKCLQGALGAYFAYQDGHTDHLGHRIFRAKNLKPYLERVKLDDIPMPTPVSPHIFNKIEEMNPDISINVWNWKEETATPNPLFIVRTITDHILSILWPLQILQNPKKENMGKRITFYGLRTQMDHHQKWCFGLGEAPQKVTMPVKDVNDFEEFRNYGHQINAPCVIIADFESLKKKCNTHYGGNMRKLTEEEANSFSYSVHWIDTEETWGPFLYRGENATEEFVQRIDQELIEINRVLAVKHERIITDDYQRRFKEADRCWICKDKFSIDTDVINMLERKIANLTAKLTEIVQDPISYNKMASPRDISKRILEMEKNNTINP